METLVICFAFLVVGPCIFLWSIWMGTRMNEREEKERMRHDQDAR